MPSFVVTAGKLTGKSTLKGLFEKAPNAVSIGLYDDPPSRDEIEAELKKAGLTRIAPEAMADLTVLARALDPGDFRQTLEKIALYKHGDDTPLTPAEVAAMAPATLEAEVDEVLHAAAEGRARRCRHADAAAGRAGGGAGDDLPDGAAPFPQPACGRDRSGRGGGGADEGARSSARAATRCSGRRRPGACGRWKASIAQLLETDLTLRSASRAPGMALVERLLIRIAMVRR